MPRRTVPPPIVARLQLTQTQKSLIVDRFRTLYTNVTRYPDIKIEAFIEMVELSRSPSPLIPLYFAQKLVVMAFAREAELPWLTDQINRGGQDD